MRFTRQVAVLVLMMATMVLAHEMTVKGTVAAVEQARIQIKTGQEKAGEPAAWYPIDAKTTIRRGGKTVTLADAKIRAEERVVAIVDHPAKGPMRTKEIRLAAR
jgi:hypothetical protein